MVAERARFRCEYCRSPEEYSPDSFSVEHIVPRVSGGLDDLENLAYACQGCNNHKFTATAGTDPSTGETGRLFHPRRDRWRDHFCWGIDGTEVIGLTPVGRATVARLALNRTGVRNLRRALRELGQHPPSEPP